MIRVVAGAWIQSGRVLAARRGPGRARAGLWELPGGKVEPGEDDREALRRELAEELGVPVEVREGLGEAVHAYDDVVVRLVAYRVEGEGSPDPSEHTELRWVSAEELADLAWAPADVPLLGPLSAALRSGSSGSG